MKFIAPEVEVLKFDVADVLTTSDATGSDPSTAATNTWVSLLGQPCAGNAIDNDLADCI